MPRTYIRQMLCFPASASQNISGGSDIAYALRDGLTATAVQVPYLRSRIVSLAHPHGAVGMSAPDQSIWSLFDVRNVSRNYNYATLRGCGFPPDILGRGEFMPVTAMANSDGDDKDEEPVFRARLSLVEGGFVLGVAVHHSTTDITGLGTLLKIWAANSRRSRNGGCDITDIGLKDGLVTAAMLDRAAVRDLGLGVAEPDIPKTIPSVLFFQDGEPAPKPDPATPQPVFTTAIFRFTPDSLKELKALITVNHMLEWIAADVPWVSTGDFLTALLWSALIAAEIGPERCAALSEDSPEPIPSYPDSMTISIPANFRARCEPPLSPDYLGAAFGRVAVSVPTLDLWRLAMPIKLCPADDHREPTFENPDSRVIMAKIAAEIRRALTSQINARSIPAAVAYTMSRPDIAAMKRQRAEGITMVSWAEQGVCALDWGLSGVGRCEAVRLSKMSGKRYPIVLPRSQDGGLEVILSLEAAEMERFREVWLMKRFSELRCLV
ncbi:hypothetical protein PG996_009936 [Apiospora saccharicola]|uniref:Trichothecene 3-O-acetyltransferase-like N-terminal domain-containing protein n=1 Tax=Apiospora saccharicola TaxID=335842 RepID=A0ABR1UPN0_9PEZI